MKRVLTPPVLRAGEPPPPLDAARALLALHLLQPWTEALLVWQRVLPARAARGFGRGPGWYAARLREIAAGLLHAADVVEGIDGRDT